MLGIGLQRRMARTRGSGLAGQLAIFSRSNEIGNEERCTRIEGHDASKD